MFGRILIFLFTLSSLNGIAQKATVSGGELKKFSQEELRSDLFLLKNILEANHPSLYWYTPRTFMDSVFSTTLASITDSMNEPTFKNRVSGFISFIRCGHTTVRGSRSYSKNAAKEKFPLFPLNIKIWSDSMVVLNNFRPHDSLLTRGTRLLSINGRDARFYIDTFSRHISGDGFGKQFASQLISSNFGSYYKNILGLDSVYKIVYLTPLGKVADTTLRNVALPELQSDKKIALTIVGRPSRRERRKIQLAEKRWLQIDSANKTALIRLGSFSGAGTAHFIRSSFRKIRHASIEHLIIDLRTNGGGKVSNSTLLTRYLSDHEFRVADTVVRNTIQLQYKKYIQQAWVYQLGMFFSSSRQSDGRYHFQKFEKKVWSPKNKNHFNGNIFLVQGGYSFSASTLFLGELKGQKNVKLVGEETGGGYYGNSAMMIPSFTLPHSQLRVSLPLYRLVINKNRPMGQGIIPDISVPPSSAAIREGIDPKLERVKSLIQSREKK